MRGGCAILVRMLHTARLDHAQRQRLQRAENRRSAEYRPRRKAGDFFVRVLIGGADIDALVRVGALDRHRRHDREAARCLTYQSSVIAY